MQIVQCKKCGEVLHVHSGVQLTEILHRFISQRKTVLFNNFFKRCAFDNFYFFFIIKVYAS